MVDKKGYERLQCPLNLNHPEHRKLYDHVIESTGGEYIAEFLRGLIRLHLEGSLISSQLRIANVVTGNHEVQDNDDYMNNLVL